MAYVCSKIEVTWHDGLWPSTAGARTLLAAGDRIDDGALLSGAVEQLVQRADYLRGSVPDFWVRGGRTTVLEWDRVRPSPRHDAALATALEAAEDLPSGTGWVLVALPDYGRQWAITPAAVRRAEWRYDRTGLSLLQRWSIEAGVASEMAVTAADGAITLETGVEILTEDGGSYLALEG